MLFFSFVLTFLAASSTANAISADEITSSLKAINSASITAASLLQVLTATNIPTNSDIQTALDASHSLRDMYNVLTNEIFRDETVIDPTADQATVNAVGLAAKNAGAVVTLYGIALANAAIGPLKKAGKFREACDDGIAIGTTIILMFTRIDVRYPSSLASDAVAAISDFAKVPVTQPLAATCLTPGELPSVAL